MQMDKPVYGKLETDFGSVELMHALHHRQNFSRHSHEGYGLGVITGGALEFYYRGETLIAGRGYVNSVNPDEVHDGHSYGENGWRYSMLYFSEDVFRNVYEEMTDSFKTPFITSGVINDPHLAVEIALLTSGVLSGGADSLEAESGLFSVLSRAAEKHSDKRPTDLKSYRLGGRLKRVKEYIADNIAKKMTLKELAELAGVSRYHFARSFKADCGLAPYEFIAVKRAGFAKKLLLSGVEPASASAESGYSDQSHMNRWLKRIYGVTPSNMSNIIL